MKNTELKAEAKRKYVECKNAYLKDMSKENWIAFCDTKKECMRLGVRI